jgi:predicted nuclease of restriction endonuclease-like (RecB) superfamily
MNDNLPQAANTLLSNIRDLLTQGRKQVLQAVNSAMVQTYWEIGRLIVEDEQKGQARAEYGKALLKNLSTSLTEEFGKGFDVRNLRNMRSFYLVFPIRNAVRTELSWTHYRMLLRVENEQARLWYIKEAIDQSWSTRALERQIGTLYYERLLATQAKHQDIQPVLAEGQQKANELGKGFAFVERQQRISTDDGDYYIDLVFYNFHLKCFLLIDLKMHKLTHQDVGQMDMYVRMYEEKKRRNDDNPTIGLILCSENNHTVAKYSVLNGSEQLFASKYMLELPSEGELREHLEQDKNRLLEPKGQYYL